MPVRTLLIRTEKAAFSIKNDAQVATMTVDDSGNARVENLFLGKYYVKEITTANWISSG